jgi:hypothetical protein
VRAADEVEVIGLQELPQHVCPEEVADATFGVLVPSARVPNGIGPEQVAKHSLGRNFRGAVEVHDLAELGEFGRYASVHAEYFFLDESGDGHGVEGVGEVLPQP